MARKKKKSVHLRNQENVSCGICKNIIWYHLTWGETHVTEFTDKMVVCSST